ncbi:MAG: Gfo/Idh/MocA family oxidoreductase [Bacteroidetes bacterium]|nr:Gfo/Idh/MocA family oxidoreductase [Bacteroidota bacterium]
MLPDYSSNKISVVFIGCGSISEYHFNVFKSLGINITAASARKGSKHLMTFTSKHKIRAYYNNKELIEKEQPDAIIVLSSWVNTSKVIDEIISYELPMLVEKPVALGINQIEQWIKTHPKSHHNVQIGYNRRFYDFIPEVKNWIDNEEITSVEAHIPERFQGGLNKKRMDDLFMANSSHVIDLLYFLLGKKPIRVVTMFSPGKGRQGYNGLLNAGSKLPIHLIANWGSPGNFGLVFHGSHKKLVLSSSRR